MRGRRTGFLRLLRWLRWGGRAAEAEGRADDRARLLLALRASWGAAPLPASELADVTGIGWPAVAHRLDELERRFLVERLPGRRFALGQGLDLISRSALPAVAGSRKSPEELA